MFCAPGVFCFRVVIVCRWKEKKACVNVMMCSYVAILSVTLGGCSLVTSMLRVGLVAVSESYVGRGRICL